MRYWFCDAAWLGKVCADVLIQTDGDVITEITVGAEAPSTAIRLTGMTIPGMANAHSHAFHRALRGNTQSGADSFWTWRNLMYDVADRIDPDTYHRLARGVYAEMVLAGITAVGEFHYLHHQQDGAPYADPNEMAAALVAAAQESGIRLTLLDTLYLSSGFGKPVEGVQRRFSDGDSKAWVERVDQLRVDPPVLIGAAIHSVRAVDQTAAGVVGEWAQNAGAPLHFHLSEQPAENEDCIRHTGMTPTEVLSAAGALGSRSTAVHATHVTETDIELLAESGTYVCLCPSTERELADGVGPAGLMRRAGVRLALGSDSHAVVDILEEARLVELHERLRDLLRGQHTTSQLLTAATADGMETLGRKGGRLEVGYLADFATVQLDSLRMAGVVDPATAVVFTAMADDVTDVVVGGRHLVKEGTHTQIEDVELELSKAILQLID